jgi:hypothetical protein
MTHSSFPASAQWSAKPFDKVHMDLKSMPMRSYHGYNFFFLILFDDCTSHGWTVNLKHKSDADPAIWQFIAKIKTQYRQTIREFQIDAGGEFKSKELTEFLKELGVNILTSVPHMHQQNSRVERFIRTIMNKSQAICLESCAPQSWWEFSVDCAVHVYNRTPIMRHNWKTPFENLEHIKPDVTHLHVFGCGTYVFLLEEVRYNKLNPKSKLMTFIGYFQGIKGYSFMRSPNNVLFTAVQALFDETLYLKCPDMCCLGYTPAPEQPDGEQGEYNIPPDDDEFGRNGGGPLPPYGPARGPRPQLPPWQPPQSGYSPLPPSPPNHPTPPVSSGLPSLVRSRAPSPSPWHSSAPSSDYDHDWFNSKEEQREYFREQAIWRQGMKKKKAKEAIKYRNAGGNEPLEYDIEGNILPYLWNRLQTDPAAQPQEGPSGSQPRRSSCVRQPVVRPDNIYGNQNPIESEQMSNQGFQRLTEGVPAPSRSGNRPKSPLMKEKARNVPITWPGLCRKEVLASLISS